VSDAPSRTDQRFTACTSVPLSISTSTDLQNVDDRILITLAIQEYFNKTTGPVKKVSMQYNRDGQSRGIADVIFSRPGLAAKAAKELNGMLVDKRPMKASTTCGRRHII
jgi:hypothetical protein